MGTGAIQADISSILLASANDGQAPLSALVWWLIPLFAFIGAIAYVIWVSRFKTKYENETNRSVNRFRKFQNSFDQDQKGASESQGNANGVTRSPNLFRDERG